MPTETAPTLLQRIAKATAEVGVLSKDRTNTHDRYSYLSEEKVKQTVQRLIAEHQIAPQHIDFELICNEWIEAKSGAKRNLVHLRCIMTWEDGSHVVGLGSGIDYADKALMKAQTSAVREAWKNRLTIPTGDDPEKDDSDTKLASGNGRSNGNGSKPPETRQHQPGGGAAEAKAKAEQAAARLIDELNKTEHPDDLKAWADGLMKLPQKDRAPLWAAFGDRCRALKLDPGNTARKGAA